MVAGIRRFGCYAGAGESTSRMNSTFENKLSQIYWNRFQKFGSTPQGSFWATEARQTRRFEIILCEVDKLSGAAGFSLADIGCGYGALVDYLLKRPASSVTSYIGYDISDQLIAACKRKFEQPWARFICSSASTDPARCACRRAQAAMGRPPLRRRESDARACLGCYSFIKIHGQAFWYTS